MKVFPLHPWTLSPERAREIQNKLRRRLRFRGGRTRPVRFLAGADMALAEGGRDGIAGVIVYSYPDLREVERVWACQKIRFPYVPGLLAFREAPLLLAAFRTLRHAPDVILIDGQGTAHPRGMGIASHMGLLLRTPTIGCAKSWLFGEYKGPGQRAGDFSELTAPHRRRGRNVIGAVLRTRDGVKPIFVSPGHLIDLESSLEIVRRCLDGVRIPKPTREADRWVSQLKRGPAPSS